MTYTLGEYSYNEIYKLLTRKNIYQYVMADGMIFVDLPENFRVNRMVNSFYMMCCLLEDEYY
jgi:hypothetical protein